MIRKLCTYSLLLSGLYADSVLFSALYAKWVLVHPGIYCALTLDRAKKSPAPREARLRLTRPPRTVAEERLKYPPA